MIRSRPTGSDISALSADGLTWRTAALPSDSDWTSLTCGGGSFLALSDGANTAARGRFA